MGQHRQRPVRLGRLREDRQRRLRGLALCLTGHHTPTVRSTHDVRKRQIRSARRRRSFPHAAGDGDGSRSPAVLPGRPGVQLNVRSGPGTGYTIVRTLPVGAQVTISCQTPGTTVTGPYGTSNIWDNIGNGQYVSDAYVKTGSDGYVAPRCG
ncbi:SH3 domain-containing protein [Streptomyces prasinus]